MPLSKVSKVLKASISFFIMEQYWELIKRIVRESDIVLEILDARFVELSRNEEVETIVKEIGRPLIFVVNKSDLISRKNLKRQLMKLREDSPLVFISTKNKRSVKILLYTIKKVFRKYGKKHVEEISNQKPLYREAKADIVVGVLGYPNIGKSSVINALTHKTKTKVSKKAGTTHGIQWIKATEEIKLIDSPGVIPLKKDDELKYALIGARDSDKLKNPEVVADSLIKLFMKYNKKSFESFYDIKIIKEDFESITLQIAKRRGYLIKGGMPDENRTNIAIVRDWQHGKLIL